MQAPPSNINTSLEARRLVQNPTKLLSLLYLKYGDIDEDYYISYSNQILYKKHSHFNLIYKENLYTDLFSGFLRRFYYKEEALERLPVLYHYYKNYLKFYCEPNLRNFYLSKLMRNYQNNKAEIFYKNNYSHSSTPKKNSNNSINKSSLSSLYNNKNNNRIIFDTKTKLLLESANKKSKYMNDKSTEALNIDLSTILSKIENFYSKRSKDSCISDIMNSFIEINNKNDIPNKETQVQKISPKNKSLKYTSQKISSKNSKKSISPKSKNRSPISFQINHHIKLIKSNINNTNSIIYENNKLNKNYKSNKYYLSKKNSNSKPRKKKCHKIRNILFTPFDNNYKNNCTSKLRQNHFKYPNIYLYPNIKKNQNKHNKANNNSVTNNTFKKSLNNLINHSNSKKFSSNITYNTQFNSNSNTPKKNLKSNTNTNTINIQKRKNKIIYKNINQNKNRTFDINIPNKKIDSKKNYSNSNILTNKYNPSLSYIKQVKKKFGSKYNLRKPNINKKNIIFIKNKKSIKNNNKNNTKTSSVKKDSKKFIYVDSCTTPNFSFNFNKKQDRKIMTNILNKNGNSKKKLKTYLTTNIINKKVNKICIKNIIHNKNSRNKGFYNKKNNNNNNISYTNNNFNINFNNVIFCSPRVTHTNNNQENILSDYTDNNTYIQNSTTNIQNSNTCISNIIKCNNNKINNFNSVYGDSRNKCKISICSRTQSQNSSVTKNLKYSYNTNVPKPEAKISKINIGLLHKTNCSEKKSQKIKGTLINKSFKIIKKVNSPKNIVIKIKQLITKSKKTRNNKYSVNHKKQLGYIENNIANNNSNNQSMYHEIFNNKMKKLGTNLIKINHGVSCNNYGGKCGSTNITISKGTDFV